MTGLAANSLSVVGRALNRSSKKRRLFCFIWDCGIGRGRGKRGLKKSEKCGLGVAGVVISSCVEGWKLGGAKILHLQDRRSPCMMYL